MTARAPLVLNASGDPAELPGGDTLNNDSYNQGLKLIANAWDGGSFSVSGTAADMRRFVAFDDNGEGVGIAASLFGVSLLNDVDAAAALTTLGLGTAATQDTGTSGANIPLLNASNTWSVQQLFQSTTQAQLRVFGWNYSGGGNASNGELIVGAATVGARIVGNASVDAGTYIENTWDNAGSFISMRLRTSGTPVEGGRFTVTGLNQTPVGATTPSTGSFTTLTFNSAEIQSGIVSPAQITANTDNYAPTGHASARHLRVSTDASRNITGLAGGTNGRVVTWSNIGSQNLVFVHDLTSTASNRFLCPGSVNFTLNGNDCVTMWYDGASSRWRIIAF